MSLFSEYDKKAEEYRKMEEQFLKDLIEIIRDKRFSDDDGIKPIGNSGICYSVPISVLAKTNTWSFKTVISDFQTKAIVQALQKKTSVGSAKTFIQKTLSDGFVKAPDGEKVKLNNKVKDFLNKLIEEDNDGQTP